MELWRGESSSDCHFCNLPDTTIMLPPLLEEKFVPVLPAHFPLPPAYWWLLWTWAWHFSVLGERCGQLSDEPCPSAHCPSNAKGHQCRAICHPSAASFMARDLSKIVILGWMWGVTALPLIGTDEESVKKAAPALGYTLLCPFRLRRLAQVACLACTGLSHPYIETYFLRHDLPLLSLSFQPGSLPQRFVILPRLSGGCLLLCSTLPWWESLGRKKPIETRLLCHCMKREPAITA